MVDYLKTFDKTTKALKCLEKDCMVCAAEKGGPCRKSNIVYKISCKECLANKIMANYFGETNFNGYTRGKQHIEKYMSKNKETMEKSAMRKHAKEVHNNFIIRKLSN